jgi:hypothetical protein
MAAALTGALAGCSPSVPDTLKIGVVVAQSGPFALRGQDLLRGAQMAADELNIGPYRIDGKEVKVEIVPFDDKGDVDLSVTGARQLLDGGAAALIGPLNTPQAVKMIPVVAETGKPHLFTATAASLHGLGKGNTFRLLGNDDLQARAAASLVAETLRAQRVAVVYESGEAARRSSTAVPRASRPGPFDHLQALRRHVHHRQVGDDAVHHAHAGQRQRALRAGSSGRPLPSFFFATCSIRMITRFTPATRSIAPPMPLTILPGIIQLARSPFSLTCIAPRMLRLILPPRIIAKLSWLPKIEVPGSVVTVCLPALIRSASTSSSVGNGADAQHAVLALQPDLLVAGTKLATSVGMPMPRLT